MPETLYSAFTLLFIGMITVFLILLLVVASGNVLIRLVNKYVPNPVEQSASFNLTKDKGAAIPAKKIAAIIAAVEMATDGKARIVKIERNNFKIK